MNQYSEYILQQMSRIRVEDAHRQADADRRIKQARNAPARKHPSQPAMIALIQSLIRNMFGWQARAPG